MMLKISKFPEVTLVEILSRMPPKSLMRFKSVGKSWYALINDPDFAAKHVSVSRHNKLSTCILFKHFVLPDLNVDMKEMVLSLFSLCNDQDDDEQNLDPTVEDLYIPHSIGLRSRDEFFMIQSQVEVSSHCDGIICLAGYEFLGQNIVLCNPSIKEFKLLPKSPLALCPKYYTNLVGVGFGCDLKSKNYKVVSVCGSGNEYFDDGRPYVTRPPRAAVYSLQTNSWKEINTDNLIKGDMLVWPQLNLVSTRGIYCKGILYWCGCENKKDLEDKYTDDEEDDDDDDPWESSKPAIVSFDIGAEEFHVISVPHDEHGHGRGDRCCLHNGALGLWNESIALCSRRGHWMSKTLDIWVLDEFCASWTKFLTLEEGISIAANIENPLTLFGKNSKQFVLVFVAIPVVIFYDICTNKFKYLSLNGVLLECSEAVEYVTSIVSLRGGKN